MNMSNMLDMFAGTYQYGLSSHMHILVRRPVVQFSDFKFLVSFFEIQVAYASFLAAIF